MSAEAQAEDMVRDRWSQIQDELKRIDVNFSRPTKCSNCPRRRPALSTVLQLAIADPEVLKATQLFCPHVKV